MDPIGFGISLALNGIFFTFVAISIIIAIIFVIKKVTMRRAVAPEVRSPIEGKDDKSEPSGTTAIS